MEHHPGTRVNMRESYDAIVIGLGGMGSAALYALARRGVAALGIEQFDIGHALGSSHGETRLIRRAYFEHPDYVPLVDEAFRAWSDLEGASGKRLFYKTGLFLAGPPSGELIGGTKLAADVHHLDIESLELADSRQRFPMFIVSDEMAVLFEPDAGFLLVEECVRTLVEQARRGGADVLPSTIVRDWRPNETGFVVETSAGTYRADKLVICGGPWAGRLLADLALPLTVRRKVVLWYAIEGEGLTLAQGCPIFGFEADGGFFYGFPSIDDRTLKLAEHTGGAPADPDWLDRTLHPDDEARVRRFAAGHLPGLGKSPARHSVCMYTMSPDQHFIVDRHPLRKGVVFAAGMSGHGFKFAPVIGNALADMAVGKRPPASLSFLSLSRPGLPPRLCQPDQE